MAVNDELGGDDALLFRKLFFVAALFKSPFSLEMTLSSRSTAGKKDKERDEDCRPKGEV